MNTEIHPKPPTNQLPEASREFAQRAIDATKDVSGAVEDVAQDAADAAKDTYQTLSSKVEVGLERTKEYAQHAVDATKDTASRAGEVAKDMCHTAALRAECTLETSREYVRQKPMTVVLGAIAFGAAIGYMLMMARRKPTFSERYLNEPLVTARTGILGALAPVAQRLHQGYDSARDGAGKAMDRLHHCNRADTLSDQISRVGSNLKFW